MREIVGLPSEGPRRGKGTNVYAVGCPFEWPFGVAAMSLDLLTQYIEHALTFERMADAEQNQGLKVDFERQATAYRRLAANRARKLGLPRPSIPARHHHAA